MKVVYLSLGSNLGNREEALQRAIGHLHRDDFQITGLSSVYETSPQDLEDQPWFLNMVVEAQTSSLFPMRLLQRVGTIEHRMGRTRTVAKGPRTIDIDILFFGAAIVNTPQLMIPHPGIPARRFVLEPLSELAPDLRHPKTNETVKQMLSKTLGQQLAKVSFQPSIPALR